MEDEEEINQLAKLSELIAKHPDLDMTLVADVLQHCNQNHAQALKILTDMASSQVNESSEHVEDQPSDEQNAKTPCEISSSSPAPKRVAHPNFVPEYNSIFESDSVQTQPVSQPGHFPKLPRNPQKPALKGVWAKKSMGGKYRVDQMWNKYKWMDRAVVEALFEQYSDCVELVEQEILQMFPVDEPEAFREEPKPSQPQRFVSQAVTGHRKKLPHSSQPQQSQQQKAIAESLRQQAAAEIQRDALRPETISIASASMANLRNKLWEIRERRMQVQQLANLTRKPEHIAEVQRVDAELRVHSSLFLTRLRDSQEYRDGIIDLHGLTKEEALQLIEWKLKDSRGQRFRVITGRGIHSQNGQAVLRPALEKHFRQKGISFSAYQDGIISVIP